MPLKKPFTALLAALMCAALAVACAPRPQGEQQPPASPAPTATAPSPSPAPAAAGYGIEEYFPITPNTMYKYVGIGSETLTQDAFPMYTGGRGVQMFTSNFEYNVTDVYRIEDGKLKVIYGDLDFYYDNLLETVDVRHMTVLQEPLELGAAWAYNAEGAMCEVTGLSAEVSVPYGEFEALEVTITHSDIVQRDYYAPGVGLVRTVYGTPGQEISLNLSEVIEGASRQAEADFCFANTTEDRLEYIKRPISLTTNMDMAEYLSAELKAAADGLPADYQPLLPGESEILSLSVDWEKVLLTVDLSEGYVDSIGAGAGIESAALQALANTLGNFYNVYSVDFLLGGERYQSGHISKPEGEYWAVEPIEAAPVESESGAQEQQ